MSTTLDRAKQEAERIANEMRSNAEKVRQNVETKINAHRGGDYAFGNIVSQLRLGHLIAMGIQVLILYSEEDRIGLSGFLLPFILIAVNVYFVGRRWHYQVDGRYDIQQLMAVKDPKVKAQYAFALFGGFVLSLLAHFLSSPMAGVSSLLYNLSDFAAIVVSAGAAGVECYEGMKGKVH
ncbi:Protein R05D7.1 [Aphelenchoides avenae]|nr:Protein R05D7.1 [Aphelenchus avenae]